MPSRLVDCYQFSEKPVTAGPSIVRKMTFAIAWHHIRPLFREQNAEEGSEHRGRWSSRLEVRPAVDIHNSYSSPNFSRSVKLRGTIWTEHVTRMEKMATAYNNVVTKLKKTLCRRLGGPQGQSGLVSRKLLSRTGIEPRTAQAVASHYTDHTALAFRFASTTWKVW